MLFDTATRDYQIGVTPKKSSQSVTSVPETEAPATGDNPSTNDVPDTPIQTGNASFAIIILAILIASSAIMLVLRKRELD